MSKIGFVRCQDSNAVPLHCERHSHHGDALECARRFLGQGITEGVEQSQLARNARYCPNSDSQYSQWCVRARAVVLRATGNIT